MRYVIVARRQVGWRFRFSFSSGAPCRGVCVFELDSVPVLRFVDMIRLKKKLIGFELSTVECV